MNSINVPDSKTHINKTKKFIDTSLNFDKINNDIRVVCPV